MFYLDTLLHLYPTRRPDTANLTMPTEPHLASPHQIALLGQAGLRQRSSKPPFFRASWAYRDALAASGRGAFFLLFRRTNRERMPQNVASSSCHSIISRRPRSAKPRTSIGNIVHDERYKSNWYNIVEVVTQKQRNRAISARFPIRHASFTNASAPDGICTHK